MLLQHLLQQSLDVAFGTTRWRCEGMAVALLKFWVSHKGLQASLRRGLHERTVFTQRDHRRHLGWVGPDLHCLQQSLQGSCPRGAAHDENLRPGHHVRVLQRAQDLREGQGHAQLWQHQPTALGPVDVHLSLTIFSGQELPDDVGLLIHIFQACHDLVFVLLRSDQDHANATVEGRSEFVAGDVAPRGDPAEEGRKLPVLRLDQRLQVLGQNPRNASGQASSGDRCSATKETFLRQSKDRLNVDPRRRQKDLSEGPCGVERCRRLIPDPRSLDY
mmetsp:Transcript_19297/g.45670  ORF Transcript_19297/g.45670 Transcript_19297/m.45670 type:complete len:274 (-) Transcript_19297:4200-5021(-)